MQWPGRHARGRARLGFHIYSTLGTSGAGTATAATTGPECRSHARGRAGTHPLAGANQGLTERFGGKTRTHFWAFGHFSRRQHAAFVATPRDARQRCRGAWRAGRSGPGGRGCRAAAGGAAPLSRRRRRRQHAWRTHPALLRHGGLPRGPAGSSETRAGHPPGIRPYNRQPPSCRHPRPLCLFAGCSRVRW